MSAMFGTRSNGSGTSTFGRSFYFLVYGRFFGSFAVQLQAVILGWQMYQLTRDPLDLGLVGLAEAIPAITLALFAGYWIDRINPKKVIICVILVSFASMFLAWHAKTTTELFTAAFLTGCARSFYSPSFQALTSRFVPKININKAIALSTSAMKLAYVTGPAAAGLILGWQGVDSAYLVGSTFLFFALAAIGTMAYDHWPYRHIPKHDALFFTDLFAGIRFVFKNRILLSALSLDMFAVLFGGVTAMLPMISEEVLHTGPQGLGFLRAAPAVGALGMSLWLIRSPVNLNAGKILLKVVGGFGLCIIAFAASKNVLLSFLLLALSGALDSVSMVIRGSIVQLSSPEEMRGRIAAVNSIFIGSSNELGAFESGIAARVLGLIPSLFFGGVMTLVTVLIIARFVPEMRKLDLETL